MIQMIVVDELKDFLQQQHMCFTDFLEALCRVASVLALPTHHDIVRAGVGSVREFMRSRARRQRLIAQRRASDVLGGGAKGEQTMAQQDATTMTPGAHVPQTEEKKGAVPAAEAAEAAMVHSAVHSGEELAERLDVFLSLVTGPIDEMCLSHTAQMAAAGKKAKSGKRRKKKRKGQGQGQGKGKGTGKGTGKGAQQSSRMYRPPKR